MSANERFPHPYKGHFILLPDQCGISQKVLLINLTQKFEHPTSEKVLLCYIETASLSQQDWPLVLLIINTNVQRHNFLMLSTNSFQSITCTLAQQVLRHDKSISKYDLNLALKARLSLMVKIILQISNGKSGKNQQMQWPNY